MNDTIHEIINVDPIVLCLYQVAIRMLTLKRIIYDFKKNSSSLFFEYELSRRDV